MGCMTQLESLPNEVLIEIFEYLTLPELYQSFKGLNQRFNSILQSLSNRAIRLWSTDNKYDAELKMFFAPAISFLDINDEYNVELHRFPKVESLTYRYATKHQLEHFLQATFCHPQLKSFDITSDDLSAVAQFFSSNQFPVLKRCVLRNVDSLRMCPWKIMPTLSSIVVCGNNDFLPTVLRSCPKLKRLSLFLFEYSDPSLSSPIVHTHLEHLTIEINRPAWSVHAIQALFSSIQTPQLISFRILSYEASPTLFDFVESARIFNEVLPHLQRFQCDLLFETDVVHIDLQLIRTLHPFLFNYIKLDRQLNDLLRIYTTSAIDRT